jgi:phosphoribosylpyrophosphate synthetase
MDEVTVFSHHTTTYLAEEIVTILRDKNYSAISGEIMWATFPDEFPNLFVKSAEALKGKKVVFVASFDKPKIIFEQMSVLFSLPRFSVKSMIIALPYFPTGTMERVDTEGQIATAKSLSRILSSIPLTQTGPPVILIYDIHCLQERFYFDDTIIPSLHSAIPRFKEELEIVFGGAKGNNNSVIL